MRILRLNLLKVAWSACWIALILAVTINQASQASNGPASVRAEIATAIRSEKPVILVVFNVVRKPNDADEAYGDWAEYLNSFSSHADRRVKIIKLTPRQYTETMADPKLKGGFATLFIRDRAHVLLYNGKILEPQIYELGQSYMLQSSDLKLFAPWGLQEITVRLR